jgi:hypothetical protein
MLGVTEKLRAAAVMTIVMLPMSAFAQQSRQNWGHPMIRIVEYEENPRSTGFSSNDCLLILADGRFHLERRNQQLPARTAALKVFEYSLTSSQLQELRAIVDAEKLRSLPTFKPPALPIVANKAGWFIADIRRGFSIKHRYSPRV